MTTLLFVYGTLKEGFPNHPFNKGVRVPGIFRTRRAFPLYVVRLANEERAPWLVDTPGDGYRVSGQLFRVDGVTLPTIDTFEEVGLPTGYVRAEIEIEPMGAEGTALRAYAYLKPEHQLAACLAREGPFPEYTHRLANGYCLSAA